MSEINNNEQVVWTPQMEDRRKNDRRNNTGELFTTGKTLNISDLKNNSERRTGEDRRKTITLTITGRAMEVDQKKVQKK